MRRALISLLVLATAVPAGVSAWENTVLGRSLIFEDTEHIQTMAHASDGQGGMLLVIVDQNPFDTPPDRVLVSRISHTGRELWGEGGLALPINVDATYDSWPFSVAHDMAGGAYVAYREGKTDTSEWILLAHVSADGSLDWTTPVQNLGVTPPGTNFGLEVIVASNGEPIVVWREFTPADIDRAARFGLTGTLLWVADVNNSGDAYADFVAVSDGADGVLVAWYEDSVPFTDTRVQRVSSAGVPLWGANGTVVWSGFGNGFQVVADAAGGAYVVTESQGKSYGRHFNASGTETWGGGTNGKELVTGTTTLPWLSRNQAACPDGGGGLFLAQGLDEIVAQHVDVAGNLLWGPTGASVYTRVGSYNLNLETTIALDGFGGIIVGFMDSYDPGGAWCQVLWHARVDLFGTKLWEREIADCEFSWNGGVAEIDLEPHGLCAVADGGAGVMNAWLVNDLHSLPQELDLEVYARGTTGLGDAPSPKLQFMAPDAASPNSTHEALVLGEYIDPTYDFVLTRGAAEISLTNLGQPSFPLVSGSLAFSGAETGAYDLEVRTGATVHHVLPNALGVGPIVPCDGDAGFLSSPNQVEVAGSPRLAGYGPDGSLHVAWVEWSVEAQGHMLLVRRRDDGGWREPIELHFEPSPIALQHPSLAVGPGGEVHVVAVIEEFGIRRLGYWFAPDGESWFLMDILDDGTQIQRPVIAAGEGELAHVVYEVDVTGVTELWHVRIEGGGIQSPEPLLAGAMTTEPDLVRVGDDLIAIYSRASWLPGVREVCYQRYDGVGGTWDAPVLVDFGLNAYSTTLAHDEAGSVLLSWILDNGITQLQPWVRTRMLALPGYTLGPIGARISDGIVYGAVVTTDGPGSFYLLTGESDGGTTTKVYLRKGTGDVFYPKRRLNTHDDVWRPVMAAQWGGDDLFALWIDYVDMDAPMYMWECQDALVDAPPSSPGVPFALALSGAPNPFNPTTTISFTVPEPGPITLEVYDVGGRLVRTLIEERVGAGAHDIRWDGRDDSGQRLGSGVYFGQLRLGREARRLKLVMLK